MQVHFSVYSPLYIKSVFSQKSIFQFPLLGIFPCIFCRVFTGCFLHVETFSHYLSSGENSKDSLDFLLRWALSKSRDYLLRLLVGSLLGRFVLLSGLC